mmetsp:Transcript_60615/g.179730  ORF Transcript_60615/g.179730 Transcript_60615/m.179730 type:complete len:237 (-) Transcript_60615:867-1577(-)
MCYFYQSAVSFLIFDVHLCWLPHRLHSLHIHPRTREVVAKVPRCRLCAKGSPQIYSHSLLRSPVNRPSDHALGMKLSAWRERASVTEVKPNKGDHTLYPSRLHLKKMNGVLVLTMANIFFRLCPCPIVLMLRLDSECLFPLRLAGDPHRHLVDYAKTFVFPYWTTCFDRYDELSTTIPYPGPADGDCYLFHQNYLVDDAFRLAAAKNNASLAQRYSLKWKPVVVTLPLGVATVPPK